MKRVYCTILEESSPSKESEVPEKMFKMNKRHPISSMNISQMVFNAQYSGKGPTNMYQVNLKNDCLKMAGNWMVLACMGGGFCLGGTMCIGF